MIDRCQLQSKGKLVLARTNNVAVIEIGRRRGGRKQSHERVLCSSYIANGLPFDDDAYVCVCV